MPKLNNLERQYPDLYREQPVLVFDDGNEVGADQKTAATVTPAFVGHTVGGESTTLSVNVVRIGIGEEGAQ